MEITFHTLTLQNFLSYGNNVNTFNLNFQEPTLIIGKNHDSAVEGQLDSNGAGKTTILNGIMYALYGKPLSDIKMNNLINNINKKDMEVSLVFQINNTFYKISRYRKNKIRGGDGVELLIREGDMKFDDPDTQGLNQEKTPDSIKNTNTKIVDILGLPYDVCARIIVYSATYEPFLSLPASHTSQANQRDIMEELCRLTILSQKADTLNKQIKEDTKELANLQIFEDRLIQEKERYEQQLINEIKRKDNWDSEKKQKLKELKEMKKSLKDIDFDSQEALLNKLSELQSRKAELKNSLKSNKQEIKNLSETIESSNEWDKNKKVKMKSFKAKIAELDHLDFDINRELFSLLDKFTDKLEIVDDDRTSLNRKIKKSLSSIEKMEGEKEHLEKSQCPYCLQTYKDAKDKLKDLLVEFEDESEKNSKNETLLTKKDKKYKSIKKKIKDIKNEMDFTNIRDLEKAELELETIKDQLESLKKEKNPFNVDGIDERIETIYAEVQGQKSDLDSMNNDIDNIDAMYDSIKDLYDDKSKFDQIDNEIKILKNESNPYCDVVEDIKKIKLDESKMDEINNLNDDIEHKKFLHKLLTKKDSFIRKALLNKNIPYLNNRLTYYLNKMGLPHKVEFTNEMTAKIRQFDTEIDFGNLSAGQKARINIALSFAFRDLLQLGHSKVNFCILDECLDTGLSNVGVQMACNMLKSIASENNLSMYIISHRDEIASMFKNSIEIELKNGFSNITNKGT